MERVRVDEVIGKKVAVGKSFSAHKHESCEIIVLEGGSALLKGETGDIAVKGGDVVLIPPNYTHCFTSDGTLFEYYHLSGIDGPYYDGIEPLVMNFASNDEVKILMTLIYLNRYTSNENYLNSLIDSLKALISSNIDYSSVVALAVNAIVMEISRNFTDPQYSVANSLVKSGYAEDYIRAKFREVTGKTPGELLTQTRIEHAKKLIGAFKGSVSLYEVAILCGYTDYAYFSRKFKQSAGISPRAYENLL